MAISWVRYVALGALFLIPFIPLYVAGWSFFPFIAGKGFVFRILVEVAAAAWVVLAFADKRYRPRFSWILVFFAGLTAWMFVADLFAVNPHKAFWSNYERMDGWVTLIHVFLLFLVAGPLLSVGKLWKRWWLAFLAGSLLVSLYGLLQLSGIFPINQGGVRVDATFGNAAYLAAYLLFAIPVAVWQAALARGWLRYALIALAALHAVILFYTATRGAILAFLAAGGLAALIALVAAGKRGRLAAGATLLALIVLVGGFILIRTTPFAQGEPTLARFTSLSIRDGDTRFKIWSIALAGAAERPLAGWGQEGFNYVFNANYNPSLYEQEQWFDRAHNVYLDWLIAGGIPALALFLALLLAAVLALWRHAEGTPARIFLISALAAYGMQATFVFDNLFTYVPLAMLLALAHTGAARPVARLERARELSQESAGTLLLPIALVLLAVILWVVNVPGMQGSARLIAALSASDARAGMASMDAALKSGTFATQEIREQLVSYLGAIVARPDVSLEDKNALYQVAVSEMSREIERAPRDARLYLHLASAFMAAGDVARAREALAFADALSPGKQSLILQRGVLELQTGDGAAALAHFRRAYELDPSFADVAAYVAAGEILAGSEAAARALLIERFGTTAVNNPVLIYAFTEAGWQRELDALAP